MSVKDLKKGDKVYVKAPPYYKDEYLYEITSAGEKLIRATLYHSPKVRKNWSAKELHILFQMGMVRLADVTEQS